MSSVTKPLASWLHPMLRENRQFHIEYRGFLSNHRSQGLVALHQLGVSEKRAREWATEYDKHLEPAKAPIGGVSESNWLQFLHQRDRYPDFLQMFDRILKINPRDHQHSQQSHNDQPPNHPLMGGIRVPGFSVQLTHPDMRTVSAMIDSVAKSTYSFPLAFAHGHDEQKNAQTVIGPPDPSSQSHESVGAPGDQWAHVESVINRFAPHLASGLVGAAFHGIIQLGMGVESRCPEMVSEGLAYLASGGLDLGKPALRTDPGKDDANTTLAALMKSLQTVADQNVVPRIIDATNRSRHAARNLSDFQRRMYTIADALRFSSAPPPADELGPEQKDSHYPALISSFAEVLRPIEQLSFGEDLSGVTQSIAEVLALAYLYSKDDFFVLHTVTSYWALRFVLQTVTSHSLKQLLLLYFLRAAVCAYIVQGAPGVDELMHALKKCPHYTPKLQTAIEWGRIVDVATATDDEHAFKVVHTLRADWTKYGQQPLFLAAAALKVGIAPEWLSDS